MSVAGDEPTLGFSAQDIEPVTINDLAGLLMDLTEELKSVKTTMKKDKKDIYAMIGELKNKSDRSDSSLSSKSSKSSKGSRKYSGVTERSRKSRSNDARNDLEMDENKDSFLRKIASAKRRNTLYPEPLRDDSRVEQRAALVVPAHQVKEDEKIQKLTVKSYMKFTKDYETYKAEAADPRLLGVSRLSDAVLEAIINHQYQKGYADSDELDINKIKCWTDRQLYRAIAEYLRPEYKQEYKELLWGGVTDYKKALPKLSIEFNLERYREDI